MITEDWDVDWICDWEDQMEEMGFAILQDDELYTGDERIARLSELRWAPPEHGEVPSALWDTNTPSIGRVRPTPQMVAFSWRIMDRDLNEAPEYPDPDDDEWIAYEDADDIDA